MGPCSMWLRALRRSVWTSVRKSFTCCLLDHSEAIDGTRTGGDVDGPRSSPAAVSPWVSVRAKRLGADTHFDHPTRPADVPDHPIRVAEAARLQRSHRAGGSVVRGGHTPAPGAFDIRVIRVRVPGTGIPARSATRWGDRLLVDTSARRRCPSR